MNLGHKQPRTDSLFGKAQLGELNATVPLQALTSSFSKCLCHPPGCKLQGGG